MHRVAVIGDARSNPEGIRSRLAGIVDVDFQPLEQARKCDLVVSTIFDVDLNNDAPFEVLREWLRRKPANAKAIFLTDRTSHLQHTRAYALGATDILYRPIDGRDLLVKMWGEIAALSAGPSNDNIRKSPAVAAAVDTLQSIFSSACPGGDIDASQVNSAGSVVVDHVEEQGLKTWIEIVRSHHSQTYQHCLLVTGLAVAFGQQIGASHASTASASRSRGCCTTSARRVFRWPFWKSRAASMKTRWRSCANTRCSGSMR